MLAELAGGSRTRPRSSGRSASGPTSPSGSPRWPGTRPGRAAATPLSAEILLRPTHRHPDLSHVLTDDDRRTVHLKLIRDSDGRPVDALHMHGHAPREDSRIVEKAIWEQLSFDHGTALPGTLGTYAPGKPQ